ncbi:MAG: phosphoserine phosphatase SerB [Methyloligellaceae bacterium]
MASQALILISNPQVCPLTEDDVTSTSKYLPDAQQVEWLSKEEALLIRFEASAIDLPVIEQHIRQKYEQYPIDIAVRPYDTLKKKLLIADMDSTIIQQECIDEIADFAGLREKVSVITERAMNGELNFDSALKERVALLKGLDENTLQQVIEKNLELTPGAKTLVQTMSKNGAYTALVSGGFTFFTSRIADMVGFHINRANILEIENGALTGNVIEPILGREAKLASLNEFAKENNLQSDETLAVGDGANDLAMIEAAGLGVAFHAKQVVAEKADAQVNYGDLTALLFMQGYKREEFVE